ncbi:hypothetical protein QU766_20005, partial [Escherichia coli]|nr:hypothetical protein [Escherichia coli]
MPEPRRADKAFTPHPAISNEHRDYNLPQWFRQHRSIRRLLALIGKRAARTVLTGMCYSVGSATRQGEQ